MCLVSRYAKSEWMDYSGSASLLVLLFTFQKINQFSPNPDRVCHSLQMTLLSPFVLKIKK